MNDQIWSCFTHLQPELSFAAPLFFWPCNVPPQNNSWMYEFPMKNFEQLEVKKIFEEKTSIFSSQNLHMQRNQPSHSEHDLTDGIEALYDKDKDRNIVSNSFKVFRKYVSDLIKIKNSKLHRVLQLKCKGYTVADFGKDFERKIPKEKNYFGIKFLRTLLNKKQKESDFAIVIRVLLHYFYKKEVYASVLTSEKILSEAKIKQIAGVRKIRKYV